MPNTRPTSANLASRINDAIDTIAEELIRYLVDSKYRPGTLPAGRLHKLALEVVGINDARLEWLSEHDDNNPQYQLYYATLSSLSVKALARAADKMNY